MPAQILLEEQRVFDNKWVTLISVPNGRGWHEGNTHDYIIFVGKKRANKVCPLNLMEDADAKIELYEKAMAEVIFYRVLKNDFFGEDWLYNDSISGDYFTFEDIQILAFHYGLAYEPISKVIEYLNDVEHRCIFEIDEDEFLEEFERECDWAQSLGYKWSVEDVVRNRFNLEFWKLPRSYRRALTD